MFFVKAVEEFHIDGQAFGSRMMSYEAQKELARAPKEWISGSEPHLML